MSNPQLLIRLSFIALISVISIHSCTIKQHCSTTAPSPAPANKEFHSRDIVFKRLCRPFPAACCLSKCNNCRPCKPVMALVRPVYSQEYDLDYYPQVWKCMCGDQLFSP